METKLEWRADFTVLPPTVVRFMRMCNKTSSPEIKTTLTQWLPNLSARQTCGRGWQEEILLHAHDVLRVPKYHRQPNSVQSVQRELLLENLKRPSCVACLKALVYFFQHMISLPWDASSYAHATVLLPLQRHRRGWQKYCSGFIPSKTLMFSCVRRYIFWEWLHKMGDFKKYGLAVHVAWGLIPQTELLLPVPQWLSLSCRTSSTDAVWASQGTSCPLSTFSAWLVVVVVVLVEENHICDFTAKNPTLGHCQEPFTSSTPLGLSSCSVWVPSASASSQALTTNTQIRLRVGTWSFDISCWASRVNAAL